MSHTNNAPLNGPIYSWAHGVMSCVTDSFKKKFTLFATVLLFDFC